MTSSTELRPVGEGAAPGDPGPSRHRKVIIRVVLLTVIMLIIAMWIYAFAFADRRPLAQLDDRSWTARAEQICQGRRDLLDANATQSLLVSDGSPQMVGAAVSAATDIVEDNLEEVLAVLPTSERDLRLVAQWEKLYRVYIGDRRAAEQRLAAGEAVELNESLLNGSPVSMTIEDFVKNNRMAACAVPQGR